MDIIESLDSIASHIESLGMVKEAHDLDVVSNTIERGQIAGRMKVARFFTHDELEKKGQQHAERLYQEYVDSAQGKKTYDKALKAHPDYNRDKDEAEAATKMILEDVGEWLKTKHKSEEMVNLLEEVMKDKILAGIT